MLLHTFHAFIVYFKCFLHLLCSYLTSMWKAGQALRPATRTQVLKLTSAMTSTSAPSTSASTFPSAPDTSVLRKYGNGKKAKQSDVDKLQLQQCMQNYFLSRTESRKNVDDDSSDSIFGKLIGKELSKITNEDVKAEVKQVLLTTVLNGQQQQRQSTGCTLRLIVTSTLATTRDCQPGVQHQQTRFRS
jgi:hypothetical protein